MRGAGVGCWLPVPGAVLHGSARGGHTLPVLGAGAGCWLCTRWRCTFFFARINSKIVRCFRFTDRCFKHATKSMDTAWPWASDTCGLCCLRAYFCAHKLIRTRSYVVIPQIKYEWAGCAHFREDVRAGAGVVVPCAGAGAVSWLSTRLRRAAALVGCWYRCRRCQLAMLTVETGYRCWCRLVVRAACTLYSLVPASRMSCDSA